MFHLVLNEVVQYPLWRHVILFQVARATKLVVYLHFECESLNLCHTLKDRQPIISLPPGGNGKVTATAVPAHEEGRCPSHLVGLN
jgi:hypothetical protein